MMTNDDAAAIGQRVRMIRGWRQLSMRAVAELAGISYSYLGYIERGEKVVTNRSILEPLANALRVSPQELSGQPFPPKDPVGSDAHAGLHNIEMALETYELGHDPGVQVRSWAEIEADVQRLRGHMHGRADYAAQGELAPALLPELHAAYIRLPEHRADVLRCLVETYGSMAITAKHVGGRGLPLLAVRLAQQCAEELGTPEWLAYSTWLRGDVSGQLNRDAQYRRAVEMAERIAPSIDRGGAPLEMCGMLHLSASLACAAQGNRDQMNTHLVEADDLAARMDTSVGTFARLWFGTENIGVWKTDLHLELGDGPHAASVAGDVHPERIPSPGRQAEFYMSLGRALTMDSATREKGVRTLLHAESLAPQRVRSDVFTRETVGDLLGRARRTDMGREVRGLAWRMGVAPVG